MKPSKYEVRGVLVAVLLASAFFCSSLFAAVSADEAAIRQTGIR